MTNKEWCEGDGPVYRTETEKALELATAEQLIEELMRRHTFQGVVLHTEHRNSWSAGKRTFKFNYSKNNLEHAEAVAIMATIAERLRFKP